MSKLFFIGMSLFSIFAFGFDKRLTKQSAPLNPQSLATGSYYAQIMTAYNNGVPYDAANEKTGTARVGRCFLLASQNTPIAAALMIKDISSDVGPIGPQSVKEMGSIWDTGKSADYYDRMNFHEIETTVQFLYFKYDLDIQEKALKTILPDGTIDLVRQDNSYVYEKLTKNDNSAFCYYFISVN